MIRADEQGNLYILSDNSGCFTIKDLPKISGKLRIVFQGDNEVVKEFDVSGQKEVIIKLTKQEIEELGIGKHLWFADLINREETDTIIYQTITIIEKEQ